MLNDWAKMNRMVRVTHEPTGSQDDFEPVDESETPTEIADAVLAMLAARVAVKPAKTPAKPGSLPTPSSNNDEIAKALVRRATYDAAELGNTMVATNVQCVFEAYVGDNKLSEKRAAGVKAKCAALGYVW